MDVKLKRPFLYYLISGLFFAIVLSGFIISRKYHDSLANAVKELQRSKANLTKMCDANNDIAVLLSSMNGLIPADFISHTPEVQIFTTLDELKSKMKGAEITMATMEDNGDSIGLPIVIKAATKDYESLFDIVVYLQSLRFPFFFVNNVSVSQPQGSENVFMYVIDGVLKIPKKIP